MSHKANKFNKKKSVTFNLSQTIVNDPKHGKIIKTEFIPYKKDLPKDAGMRKIYEEYATEPKLYKSEVVLETKKNPDGGETLKYTLVNKPFDPSVGWNPEHPDLQVEESYEDENGDLIEQFIEEDYYEDEEGFEEGGYDDDDFEEAEEDFEEAEEEPPILEEIEQEQEETTKKMKKEEIINLSGEDYQKKLDEEFDSFVHNYDDEEIGELEDKDIVGEKKELDIEHYIKDLLENPEYNLGRYYEDEDEKVVTKEEVDEFAGALGGLAFKKGDNPYSKVTKDEIIEYTLEAIRRQKEEEEAREGEEEEDILEPYLREKEEQWDCESIISTYSNTENHPKLLFEEDDKKKIKLSAKSGIPLNVLNSRPIIKKKKAPVVKDLGNSRDKLESLEDKRLRKQQVKQAKREKREVKKATKDAFKKEEVKQSKINAIPQQKQKIVVKY
eukprot:gene8729-677_t